MECKIRSPIVSVLGHVDHGKSSILDAIRETNILATEAGAITQEIGASMVPLEAIKKRCGPLFEKSGIKFTVPGLLFIDTPGHAAFTSLRKRGGALADIAIVVIDINEGFQPQTKEAIEILKSSKTPFVIAANKVDLVPGYIKKQDYLIPDISAQSDNTVTTIETRMYGIVGKLHEDFQLPADRFDRVKDFTKQIAIVPCSATQKIGMGELLMVVSGLAQKYLEDSLKVDVSGKAKGTILEVKESKGLGTTIDVILYEGTLKTNDTIVIGGLDQPIVTKIRALLEPSPMNEMRDKKSKFQNVTRICAAAGVKISAPGMEDALAGMPIVSAEDDVEEMKEQIQQEIASVLVETDKAGVIVKADSIGSLEALLHIMKEKEIPVAKASVGSITKRDLANAEGSYEKDPLKGAIFGFNLGKVEAPKHIKLITGDIIYRLFEEFEEWQEKEKERQEASELRGLVRPCKIEFLTGHTFRQCNPAVIGVAVLEGKLQAGTPLMKTEGTAVGIIKSIQEDQDTVQSAERGKRVAISIPGVTIGRQLVEGETLLSAIPEDHFRKLKTLRKHLKDEEIQIMKEIAKIFREANPVWGV